MEHHVGTPLASGMGYDELRRRPAVDTVRLGSRMVGLTGFEPATPSPPVRCATKLRHSPIAVVTTTSESIPCPLAAVTTGPVLPIAGLAVVDTQTVAVITVSCHDLEK